MHLVRMSHPFLGFLQCQPRVLGIFFSIYRVEARVLLGTLQHTRHTHTHTPPAAQHFAGPQCQQSRC